MEQGNNPKILIYDLELTPTLGWTYGLYDTRVLKVEKYHIIMSFSYSWYEQGKTTKIYHERISQQDLKKWSDKKLANKLRDLFTEADIVIAHNASRFDNKEAIGAMIRNKLLPPKPYKTIDTLTVARSVARFESNSLDSLCERFGIGKKSVVKHADLWWECINGDKKSWKLMEQYNNRDVEMLTGLYEVLRPYMRNHPNLGDITQVDGVCPVCLSSRLNKEGTHARRSGRVQSYSCKSCGHWCNESSIIKPKGRLVNA